MQDLEYLNKEELQNNKSLNHLLLIVDRGPDNTWKGSLSNIVEYGKLWRKLKSLLVVVTGFHPCDSAFYPVERALSKPTFDITGTCFSDLDDNGVKITKKSDPALSDALFDLRIADLNALWNNTVHDGHTVRSLRPEPVAPEKLESFKALHDYLMSNKPHDNSGINKEISFFVDHLVKTKNYLYFGHCFLFDRDPCEHCKTLPSPSSFLQEIKSRYGTLPFPVTSASHPGHFTSLLDIRDKTDFSDRKEANMCEKHLYFFDSEAD